MVKFGDITYADPFLGHLWDERRMHEIVEAMQAALEDRRPGASVR